MACRSDVLRLPADWLGSRCAACASRCIEHLIANCGSDRPCTLDHNIAWAGTRNGCRSRVEHRALLHAPFAVRFLDDLVLARAVRRRLHHRLSGPDTRSGRPRQPHQHGETQVAGRILVNYRHGVVHSRSAASPAWRMLRSSLPLARSLQPDWRGYGCEKGSDCGPWSRVSWHSQALRS